MKTGGVTEAEAGDTRETLLRSYETSLRQNGFWLNQFVSDYQRGEEPGATVRYTSSVKALTSEAIQKAAAKHFNMENYVPRDAQPER